MYDPWGEREHIMEECDNAKIYILVLGRNLSRLLNI